MKVDRTKDGVFSDDGWFRSGDLGYFDLDNELYVVDRKKDVIRYKGYQVSPSDIEQFVEKHIDIKAMVVIGLPDPVFDGMQVPAALVIKSDSNPNVTEDDICKIVAGETSSGYYSIFRAENDFFFFVIPRQHDGQ